MTISTRSISSVIIKRAIQQGQKSRYSWITPPLSHKKLTGSQFTNHHCTVNGPMIISKII